MQVQPMQMSAHCIMHVPRRAVSAAAVGGGCAGAELARTSALSASADSRHTGHVPLILIHTSTQLAQNACPHASVIWSPPPSARPSRQMGHVDITCALHTVSTKYASI